MIIRTSKNYFITKPFESDTGDKITRVTFITVTQNNGKSFMQNLENKVVLITGASSGFGEDAALLFAKEGCKVVLAARRIDRLQNLAAKIQDLGGEAIAIPVDIVDSA